MASFWSEPWPFALGQQIYAFLLGVIYAYCLEKSRSVLAPAIGHNVSDGVEYVLLFLMVGFWPPG
jgi:membrane protease YdiL (CAAX protease family)